MNPSNYHPHETPEWQMLESLAISTTGESILDYFKNDPKRLENYSIKCSSLYLDYSKNKLNDEVLTCLHGLLERSPFKEQRNALFTGQAINSTENRPALHTALRAPQTDLEIGKVKLDQLIREQQSAMQQTSEAVRSGNYTGSTGKAITDVINIGIGGSDLGPRLVCEALTEFQTTEIKLHFISNVDGAAISTLLGQLNPETSLFLICSKTFTTQETMLNANVACTWLKENLSILNPENSAHFMAITANRKRALEYGINSNNIFDFEDWVGGRYSLWSSIGLSICIAIGYENFKQLLAGAHDMDEHFKCAPPEKNMPVVLALLGIWYSNFIGAESTAVIPYCERLHSLPAYLQQLDMESNGKSATRTETNTDVLTGPIVWGQTGTNGQHAFFQLLHQGTRNVPIDLIATVKENLGDKHQHQVLLTNMIAQSAVLMAGEHNEDIHKNYPGNKPSNTILLDELTPQSLGMLIALYEHKVFVQGVIWNINSYDQWGVELGKRLTTTLLDEKLPENLDASTAELLRRAHSQD
jgi:glucose-6-phosphate isomerase